MADEKNYEVGYGRPPRHTQFRKGQSPNPAGRPKGARGLKTDLAAELRELVTIKENGKKRRLTKQQVMLKAQIQKAMKGDPRAANTTIALIIRAFGMEGETRADTALPPSDQEIIQNYLQRFLPGEEKP